MKISEIVIYLIISKYIQNTYALNGETLVKETLTSWKISKFTGMNFELMLIWKNETVDDIKVKKIFFI